MATRLRNINDKASEIAKVRFEKLLQEGAWSEVQYKKDTELGGTSYSMFEYSRTWASFTKAVHDRLVQAGFEFGLWQNARNASYLGAVSKTVDGLTVADVDLGNRFKTWCD